MMHNESKEDIDEERDVADWPFTSSNSGMEEELL